MRKRIVVVSVPVADQARAMDFYTDVLGFEVLRELPMQQGSNWVQLALPRDDTSITLVTWFESMPAGSLRGAVINVDNIETYRAELIGNGASPSEISSAPWGRYFTVADLDGNRWVVQQDPI
ncbi:MAG: VOC family protein [Methyloceanibacter sp.]|jgi:catechol 2,3-dioxygenase-like lactoylglutathione lyase family enzyme